ncbi:MAG: toprim domain-containing protein [Nitrososphaerota archaeon]
MLPPLFKKIIQFFDNFPEIGPRQAWRLFFWFVKQDKKFKETFLESLKALIENLNFCKYCNFPIISDEICEICKDPKRSKSTLCIVARETDLITIENLKKYRGVYYVIGGLLLPFEEKEYVKENLIKLKKRFEEDKNIKEVILALPFTKEAEPLKKEVIKIVEKFNVKIRGLKKGIPTGGEIEFIDPETLKEALEL